MHCIEASSNGHSIIGTLHVEAVTEQLRSQRGGVLLPGNHRKVSTMVFKYALLYSFFVIAIGAMVGNFP